jgi:hypothetical protein
MSAEINNEGRGDTMVFETLRVRREGAVLFGEMSKLEWKLLTKKRGSSTSQGIPPGRKSSFG